MGGLATETRYRLLSLISDSLEAYEKLGTYEQTFKYFAPAALFERIYFCYTFEQDAEFVLDDRYIVRKFRKRCGRNLLSKGIFFFADTLVYLAGLRRLVKEAGIDLIRARSVEYPAFVGALLGKMTGIPCVVSIHNDHIMDRKINRYPRHTAWPLALYERFSLRNADRIFCVSTYLKAYVMRHYGVPEEKIRILFNRVNIKRFERRNTEREDALRAKLGIPREAPVILFVGRLAPQKNLEALLEAFAKVRAVRSSSRLLLVGDGHLQQFVKQEIERLRLEGNVLLIGNVVHGDLPTYFHIADAFVLPSWYEGFGIVLIEAQAARTPVVASDIPGVKDIVSHENSLLFDPSDANALAQHLLRLIEDPALGKELAVRGFAGIRRFDEDLIEQREAELYLELLMNRAARNPGR